MLKIEFVLLVVCNPCQSSPSLTTLVPLWCNIISSLFFFLSRISFSGFLQFGGNFVRGRKNNLNRNKHQQRAVRIKFRWPIAIKIGVLHNFYTVRELLINWPLLSGYSSSLDGLWWKFLWLRGGPCRIVELRYGPFAEQTQNGNSEARGGRCREVVVRFDLGSKVSVC